MQLLIVQLNWGKSTPDNCEKETFKRIHSHQFILKSINMTNQNIDKIVHQVTSMYDQDIIAKLIDRSTPAYVFYFMQSMMQTGKEMGFSTNESKLLANKTYAHAVELFSQSKLTPKIGLKKLPSKESTTMNTIDSMDEKNIEKLIKVAAFKAFNRTVDYAKKQAK